MLLQTVEILSSEFLPKRKQSLTNILRQLRSPPASQRREIGTPVTANDGRTLNVTYSGFKKRQK